MNTTQARRLSEIATQRQELARAEQELERTQEIYPEAAVVVNLRRLRARVGTRPLSLSELAVAGVGSVAMRDFVEL